MSAETAPPIRWSDAESYEPYIGRWSRLVAREFVAWLGLPPGARWLETGCGTGPLTSEILRVANPGSVVASDPSETYIAHARSTVDDSRVAFAVGRAEALSADDASVDAAVSGLVLNFVDDPSAALVEAVRVTRPGGVVGAYIWDYAGEMWSIRHFWDTATLLDPVARRRHEGRRFASWMPDELAHRFRAAGLVDIELHPIDITTVYADFDDYWSPLLVNQGSAPSYVATLQPEAVAALREAIRRAMPVAPDGSISLPARAWAVRGTVPVSA
ncbi:class I SAM-dependent methyltransferase [Labedella endophytica]|uniref:Methyltransferase domain-containing protein n=1 Tax=Labedella endophytica TaxID=1523160 RepID=A0A3S0X981_9MICO|nr:methyltransferase domain-containing protein [Labedella endophytica]RUQ99081.1 methyltransferase domain-containing protein [Labedella endophytica]